MFIVWPEIFDTMELRYGDSTSGKLKACADALTAWTNCSLCGLSKGEHEIHPNFGEAMAKINLFLGCIQEDGVMKLSYELEAKLDREAP